MNETVDWKGQEVSRRESKKKYQRQRVSTHNKNDGAHSLEGAERLEMAVRIAGIGHFKVVCADW